MLEKVATLRARLEGAIAGNLALLRGLVAPLSLEPEMSRARFAALAAQLFAQPNQLRNVGAARDLIISHVYPLRGNESILGVDYRDLPKQRDAALRARDTGQIVVAGPVALMQGGFALIGRMPVFMPGGPALAESRSERFWGIVSCVIPVEALLSHAGIRQPGLGLRVALRGVDGLGGVGKVFDGDGGLFQDDSVTVNVALPGGSWQLAAAPVQGWEVLAARRWEVRAGAGLLGGVLALLCWVRGRQHEERRLSRERLGVFRLRMKDAMESLADGFAVWDAEGCLLMSNRRFASMMGVPAAIGAGHAKILGDAQASQAVRGDGDPHAWFLQVLQQRQARSEHRELVLGSGRTVQLSQRPTAEGGVVEVYTDITRLRQAEADMRKRANVDPLTGLSNRSRFIEMLGDAIEAAIANGQRAALLFVDLDRFKNINDSLGHDTGDRLLEAAAGRIQGCAGAGDTVARLGGDEFTVLLENLDSELTPSRVASRITEVLSQPFELAGQQVHAGASIGITLLPGDGVDARTLLKNADMAMYRAKDSGRNTHCFFSLEMSELAQQRVSLENDLRHAFAAGELSIAYQPIISLERGEATGVEALLRWQHPRRGAVSPAEFIPVAEESGLIVPIGAWVLRRACEEISAAWADLDQPPRLSINVSCRQLRGGFGASLVREVLAATDFPAGALVVEITESTLLDDDVRIRNSLAELRELGVGLAVDDFGTGYSSLSYLRRLPVTELKIDKSFIRDMESDPQDARLVETIIAMARGLGLTAVAEGVETPGQRDLLRGLGCPLAQGFYLGRPVPVQALAVRPIAAAEPRHAASGRA